MNERTSVMMKSTAFSLWFSLPVAAGIVLADWLAYTGLQALIITGRLAQPLSTVLELLPGLLSVIALFLAGFTRQGCFLRIAPLSGKGLLALASTIPLLLPIFLVCVWNGWNPLGVFVYAPATAISQELFYRCSLLPLSLRTLKGRPYLAICLVALLFGLWHIGPLVQGRAWYAVLPVMIVPFLYGLAWNYQVCHDRTVLWVAIYHLLINQAMSLFSWG